MTHRASIAVEAAEILTHTAWPGGQYVLTVRAPRSASRARPGQFAHIAVGDGIAMRRPISILSADREAGTLGFLYKAVGMGTAALARRQPGERLSLMAPIGTPFVPHPGRPRPLLLGGGVGIPPMLFLATQLRAEASPDVHPLVLMGSEVPFPFATVASRLPVPGVGPQVQEALADLEAIGVASRLASLQGYPGCHQGYVTDLARSWIEALTPVERAEVEVFACGPHPMLVAAARLAQEHGLPCQVSLEEYMACGVGACAGCVVPIQTPEGPAMKRVCVDGPVFDARVIFG